MLTHDMKVHMTADGTCSRRSFLRASAVGAAGLAGISFTDALRAAAPELRKRGMSCILLFMRGGPSQFETFDPKPGTSTGGPTKAIASAVKGIEVAEGWEKVAAQMKDIALIRGMTNREGNHQRAVYQVHTGYAPSGSIKYPSIGALAASELHAEDFDLPSFVSVGARGEGIGSGFLGMKYAPFVVQDANRMPQNTELPRSVAADRYRRRLGLMEKLEQDFADSGGRARVEDHRQLYDTAAKMVLSPKLKAFDLAGENSSLRDRYGRSSFGQGCLLARRLVETGVTFVEVTSDGWDTHRDNFEAIKRIAGGVDPGFGTLVADLRDRGRLDKTLVVWVGEFGRTPNINGNTGRDHYPRAFCAAVAGGGIKGGQALGKTDKDGRDVTDRRVQVNDLLVTICHALGINPRKENQSGVGRPIKIVDGGELVKELF
jgi:uncharacterized protein (DUF1501 family)